MGKNTMANKKQTKVETTNNQEQVQEQTLVITTATTHEISNMVRALFENHPDFMVSTTQVKKHKQDIKQVLNISDKVYLSILAAYKDICIMKAKKDRDNDKEYLKDFEHTAQMVLQDMQTDVKYSTYLREIIKQYKDNVLQFVYDWSKEFDGNKFLTIHTLYNVEEQVIIKRYGEDNKLTYNKVYTLVSKCIDNLFAARKAGIKDKEFRLSKYTDGYITGVYKFGEFADNGRPKRGEKVEKPTEKMISNLLSWEEYMDSL